MKTNIDYPLVRFLSTTGFGSRRACDELIKEGRVKVNGIVAGHGIRINPNSDVIMVDNQKAELPPVFLYLLLYKPKGYLVSDADPENRPLAKDLLPDFSMRLFPVGRLDFQTEGAILFTNDGLFANEIAHPRNKIPKTYLAKVRNVPTVATLYRWQKGIRDENQILKASSVNIEKTTKQNAWLKVTLTGGANRQVRRMGKATGHPVVKLIRISIGNLDVGSLRPGESRELTGKEIKALRNYQPKAEKTAEKALNSGLKRRIAPRKPSRKQSTKKSFHSTEGKRNEPSKAIKNRRSK